MYGIKYIAGLTRRDRYLILNAIIPSFTKRHFIVRSTVQKTIFGEVMCTQNTPVEEYPLKLDLYPYHTYRPLGMFSDGILETHISRSFLAFFFLCIPYFSFLLQSPGSGHYYQGKIASSPFTTGFLAHVIRLVMGSGVM